MAKQDEKIGYTQQQRHDLAKQFNQVLTRCTDQAFGQALAAAAKVIRNNSVKTGCL